MNSICNHINARYDNRQLQLAQAYENYLEDQRMCMLFDAVNANHTKKNVPVLAPKRDYISGIGLLGGLSAMALFLTIGFIFGL